MDNSVNFNDIKIINTLGTGMYGTTYLAKYNNDNYALKIQHILPSDRNKSYKKGLWRELDLYEYINSLSESQQIFFTKLYDYEIIDNCNHKQIRPFKIDLKDKKNKFAMNLIELDKSNWCAKFLTEYKGWIFLFQIFISPLSIHIFCIVVQVSGGKIQPLYLSSPFLPNNIFLSFSIFIKLSVKN